MSIKNNRKRIDVEFFREKILGELASIDGGLEVEMENIETKGDLADQALWITALAQQVASNAIKSRRVTALTAALERLDSKSYGNCEKCRRPIGLLRLKASPEVLHCAECAKSNKFDRTGWKW